MRATGAGGVCRYMRLQGGHYHDWRKVQYKIRDRNKNSIATRVRVCNHARMKLHDYRIKNKLSISELAALLGLSQPYVSQILRGDRIGSIKTAKQIQERTGGKVKAAEVLGV